ncbi:hypothetical protein PROFUN_14429 [Planoprotostelium fungivorum]|uniref:Uncharacterized protein n=1 Tax=Planoprotostelium fungivorum TaxID=1890364 RepID=A0A2P6N096_9EUKA|nr:hypothetical protein PROFUN_14429 [Planoprotostelium fungivorum]
MAEQATTTLQALLNTDTSDVITALQSLEDCSKLRIIIEKMKEQLPGRTEILQLRSSVPAESEERKIVDNTRLITYKTNKDEWEGEKTGSFATWINWSLVEVKMEHMTEPLQLAFKHSIYSRNYYLEEDEGFGITWSYEKEEGKLWNSSVNYSTRTYQLEQMERVKEILKTNLSEKQLIHLLTRACVMPFFASTTPRLDLPTEQQLFDYKSFTSSVDNMKPHEIAQDEKSSPRSRSKSVDGKVAPIDLLASPTKKRKVNA